MPRSSPAAPQRRPIHCILPPHVLRNIARNGGDAERDAALGSLALDETARAERSAIAIETPPAALRAMRGGALLGAMRSAKPKPRRTIHDAGGTEELPGRVVRAEGQRATGDKAADEAYAGLGATWDFLFDEYGRDSLDGEGMPLVATVHFGRQYDNAFWDGQQMVFGDGDGQLFHRFTVAPDIIGHELAHGLVTHECNLRYRGQPGALNEHVADVFGSLVLQRKAKQTADQAHWLIGKGLLTRRVQGVALRSMQAPGTAYDDPLLGKDPQPDHMDRYVRTTQDYGGVHINSGIPNKAFYLVAMTIGGKAWERAGRIWYETVRDPRVRTTATFSDFAVRTVFNARALYGTRSAEARAVLDAWRAVGVPVGARRLFGVTAPVEPAIAAAAGLAPGGVVVPSDAAGVPRTDALPTRGTHAAAAPRRRGR
jgi:Zn-dependent metalloprotease